MGLVQELLARGILAQHSAPVEQLEEFLAKEPRTLYCGFDPTADSLHVGNLLPIMGLRHFQLAGHRPIAVMGGGTGMVGDPSGKDAERQLLDQDAIEHNLAGQRKQMERLLEFSGNGAALMVNNADWLASLQLLDFLRDIGKSFRIGEMIARESVKRRLEGEGMSFTEFSYQLLQGYDFFQLFKQYDCRIQIGGTDQWGNIVAGIDLIRKQCGGEAFALTFPLITTASGEKFGKSAGNAIWLDPEKTSPYQFYQFWIRTDDRDVEDYLKYFTHLPLSEIEELCRTHDAAPEKRQAQQVLAKEVTLLLHGQENLAGALKASHALFGGELTGLADRELEEAFSEAPSTQLPRQQLAEGISAIELLTLTGLCSSKGAARKLIQAGGAYVNNQRLTDIKAMITLAELASERIIILRSGKKNHHLVRLD